jgi:hypothetical protein
MSLRSRLKESYEYWVIPCLAKQLGLSSDASLEQIKQAPLPTINSNESQPDDKGTS